MKLIPLICALALMTVTISNAQTKSDIPAITVQGEGVINVVPDNVTIRVRVEEEGKSATEVKEKTDTSVDKVLTFLKTVKIAPKNVQTNYIRLDKNYDYNTKVYKYNANQSITILLEDINQYETLMSGLVGSGINRIDGIQFGSKNYNTLEIEARKLAVKNAKKKAEEFVSVLDQKVGKAISITEVANNYNPQPRMMMAEMKMDDSSAPKETLAKGELEITVNVNVTFELLN